MPHPASSFRWPTPDSRTPAVQGWNRNLCCALYGSRFPIHVLFGNQWNIFYVGDGFKIILEMENCFVFYVENSFHFRLNLGTESQSYVEAVFKIKFKLNIKLTNFWKSVFNVLCTPFPNWHRFANKCPQDVSHRFYPFLVQKTASIKYSSFQNT